MRTSLITRNLLHTSNLNGDNFTAIIWILNYLYVKIYFKKVGMWKSRSEKNQLIALVNLKTVQNQDTKDTGLVHVHVNEEYELCLLARLEKLGSHDLILQKPLMQLKHVGCWRTAEEVSSSIHTIKHRLKTYKLEFSCMSQFHVGATTCVTLKKFDEAKKWCEQGLSVSFIAFDL